MCNHKFQYEGKEQDGTLCLQRYCIRCELREETCVEVPKWYVKQGAKAE